MLRPMTFVLPGLWDGKETNVSAERRLLELRGDESLMPEDVQSYEKVSYLEYFPIVKLSLPRRLFGIADYTATS